MRLELGDFPTTDVVLGSKTAWHDGVLEVDRDGLVAEILTDDRMVSASIELAKPGESVRIWPVRDVLEPRVKVEGPGVAYPGMYGRDVATVGSGRTHRLSNVGVTEVCELLWHDGGGDYQDLPVDMSGPWADYMPTAKLLNVCVVVEPDRNLDINEQNAAVHTAALLVSDRLAASVKEMTPRRLDVFELPAPEKPLPKVFYVQFLHSPFAKSHDLHTFMTGVYGLSQLVPPWLLHPNEVIDTAISGPYRTGFALSWTVANNPVLLELYRRHGKDIDFRGVIAFKTEWTTQIEKNLMAAQAVKQLTMLEADGVIMTWDAGGNEYLEVAYTLQGCEQAGIKTVLLTGEDRGDDGGDPSLLEPVPEADALISTGFNYGHEGDFPDYPRLERVIGNATRGTWRVKGVVTHGTQDVHGPLNPPWRYNDHYGFNTTSVVAY